MSDSVLARLKAWWGEVPCVTRFVFYTLPTFTALCYLFPLTIYLVNTLYYSVFKLQGTSYPVYRLLTTTVITGGAIDV